MQIATSELTPREQYVLGKLVAKMNPELAKEYLSDYRTAQSKALDNDHHNLNDHFLNFCDLFGIDKPRSYLGGISDRKKAETRKLFVGAMVRMYKPQIFTHDISESDGGLKEKLCVVLKYDSGNMTHLVDEVKACYNNNFPLMDNETGFSDAVDSLVEQLISMRDGYAANLFTTQPAA